MKVQVSAVISQYPLIAAVDRQIIMDVLEKQKDCVSVLAHAGAGVNSKFV